MWSCSFLHRRQLKISKEHLSQCFLSVGHPNDNVKKQYLSTFTSSSSSVTKEASREHLLMLPLWNGKKKRRKSLKLSSHWPCKMSCSFWQEQETHLLEALREALHLFVMLLKVPELRPILVQLTIPVNERYFSEESASFISNFADDIFDEQGYGCVWHWIMITLNHSIVCPFYRSTHRENQLISWDRLCSLTLSKEMQWKICSRQCHDVCLYLCTGFVGLYYPVLCVKPAPCWRVVVGVVLVVVHDCLSKITQWIFWWIDLFTLY